MTSDSKAVCGGGEREAQILKGLWSARDLLLNHCSDWSPEHGTTVKGKFVRDAFDGIDGAIRLLNGPAALASTARAAAGDWQPIKTCPSDGRTIIAFGGRFDEPTPTQADGSWWNSTAGRTLRGSPTHWMPLPAAPGQSPAVPASPRSGAGEGEAFSKIRAGLEDALAFANGDTSRADLRAFIVKDGQAREVSASPPAPAEHGVEIREAAQAVLTWFERQAGMYDLCPEMAQLRAALSQGGQAGGSDPAGEDPRGLRAKPASAVANGDAPSGNPLTKTKEGSEHV